METTSNMSIVGMGFWKWVYSTLQWVESTESMRTSEHPRGTSLYDQVLQQYDYFFYYKKAEGLVLPHTSSSILPPESSRLQKKLNSQSLTQLSKLRSQEKTQQAQDRRDRLAGALTNSLAAPPPPARLITLSESHSDLSFGYTQTKEENAAERAILAAMGDFDAKQGDSGLIVCIRCRRSR